MRTWFRNRLDPGERYGLRLSLLAIALFLVAVPFGWLLNQVARKGSLVRSDTAAARHLNDWANDTPAFVDVLKVVTFFGAPVWCYLLVVPTALLLWKRHLPRLAVFLLATTVGGGLLNTAVKLAVNRPRPSLLDPVATAHGRSFPSGHAMSSTIVYGALLLVVLPWVTPARRRLAVAGAVVMVLMVGFSRLALGVHYLSDVVAGYVLGCAWLAASTAAFGTWRVERAREPGEPPDPPHDMVPGSARRQ
ncbi:MAG TPA: phosphatase PAP2 family protein [Acidimicrobiales bacterium]|nr:phosphatase PAP2 family protein [Acidimicrobiales bacterium]